MNESGCFNGLCSYVFKSLLPILFDMISCWMRKKCLSLFFTDSRLFFVDFLRCNKKAFFWSNQTVYVQFNPLWINWAFAMSKIKLVIRTIWFANSQQFEHFLLAHISNVCGSCSSLSIITVKKWLSY